MSAYTLTSENCDFHSETSSMADSEASRVTIGRWTTEEHEKFLEAVQLFDKDWRKIADFVGTRNNIQCRTHAQKHYKRLSGSLRLKKGKSSSGSYMSDECSSVAGCDEVAEQGDVSVGESSEEEPDIRIIAEHPTTLSQFASHFGNQVKTVLPSLQRFQNQSGKRNLDQPFSFQRYYQYFAPISSNNRGFQSSNSGFLHCGPVNQASSCFQPFMHNMQNSQHSLMRLQQTIL